MNRWLPAWIGGGACLVLVVAILVICALALHGHITEQRGSALTAANKAKEEGS